MRYLFIRKSTREQFVYANDEEAALDFFKMFDRDLNWRLLRSLVINCVADFIFENEEFILKGYKDD